MPGLEAAKAYVALVGAVATALLGIYGPETEVGHWLTVIVAVSTALATFAVPNRHPRAQHQSESVQPPRPEPRLPDPDRGHVDLATVLLLGVAVGLTALWLVVLGVV
jgi:hypothetical protein